MLAQPDPIFASQESRPLTSASSSVELLAEVSGEPADAG